MWVRQGGREQSRPSNLKPDRSEKMNTTARLVPINHLREELIERRARELLGEFWKQEQARQGRRIDALSMLPIDPMAIATRTLGLTIEEPNEEWFLPSEGHLRPAGAGLVRAGEKKIVLLSHGLERVVKRYTLGHEIGHYVLHPYVTQFREHPATEAAIRSQVRSPRERDADQFAAALLMPRRLVLKIFEQFVGDPIVGRNLTDEQAFALVGERYWASEIAKMTPLQRAILVATRTSLVHANQRPLADIFDVSPTAMGVRLLRLRLVE